MNWEDNDGTRNVEVYYSDLNKEAQIEFLEAHGVTTAEEANIDMIPIAIIDLDIESLELSDEDN